MKENVSGCFFSEHSVQVTYQVRPHLFQRILRTREAIGPDGPISP